MDTDTIARYCEPRSLDDDDNLTHTCFIPRLMRDGKREEYISTDWLEYYKHSSMEENLIEAVNTLDRKLKGLDDDGKIAVLQVETIKNQFTAQELEVNVKQIKKSHCGIFYNPNALIAAYILAEKCIMETFNTTDFH